MWKLTLGYGGVRVYKRAVQGVKNRRTFILYIFGGSWEKK